MKMPKVQVYQATQAPETHAWMICVGIPTGSCWTWVNCFGPTEQIARDKAKVILDEWVEKRTAYEARASKANASKARHLV
jgi:hypothetical protein